MRFQLGTSAAATEALAAAADHTIDALSVEVVGVERTGGTIKNSLLKAVAMVPFPAFPGARIYAEDGTPIEATTPDPAPEPPQQETPVTKTTYPATSPIPVDDPKALTADGAFPKISAAQAVEIICGVHTGKITGDEIHAALQNITGSGTLVTEPAVWLGEIWSSVEYERRLINLIDTQPLTGRRAKGFRWATDADTGKQLKPGVGKWSGDKTEITSKPVKFEEVDERAQPWAGGNDLDRQIIDFNESETLLAYWRAMTESYKRETDMDVAAQLTTWATDVPEEQEDIIQAILFGGIYVEEEVLTPASYAIINPKDKRKIAKYTELNTPKFMDVTPVGSLTGGSPVRLCRKKPQLSVSVVLLLSMSSPVPRFAPTPNISPWVVKMWRSSAIPRISRIRSQAWSRYISSEQSRKCGSAGVAGCRCSG